VLSVVWSVTVSVDIVVVARVEVPVTAREPVVVALTEVSPWKLPLVAEKLTVKKLVDELLVVDELIVARLVIVALSKRALAA
jgi:hypothetical protein